METGSRTSGYFLISFVASFFKLQLLTFTLYAFGALKTVDPAIIVVIVVQVVLSAVFAWFDVQMLAHLEGGRADSVMKHPTDPGRWRFIMVSVSFFAVVLLLLLFAGWYSQHFFGSSNIPVVGLLGVVVIAGLAFGGMGLMYGARARFRQRQRDASD
jgi:hypothetical protein